MQRLLRIVLSAALLAAVPHRQAAAADSHAGACAVSPKKRAAADPARRDYLCVDRHAKSGYAHTVAPWAKWAYGPKYKSYYVGGSQAPFHYTPAVAQHPRTLDEGTWGTDYAPWYSKVQLNWTHGQLYQDAGGQYEPDHRNYPFRLRFAAPPQHHHAHTDAHSGPCEHGAE